MSDDAAPSRPCILPAWPRKPLQTQIRQFLAREPDWSLVASNVMRGRVTFTRRSGKTTRFNIEVEFAPDLSADQIPKVRIIECDSDLVLDLESHVYDDGTLCLQAPGDRDIDFDSGGLQKFMAQVVLHLQRIVIRSLCGYYPGPARSHGAPGIWEAAVDRRTAD